MIIPTILIGLTSTIITEILRVVPFFNKTKQRKKMLAFVVAIGVAIVYLITTETEYSGQGIAALMTGAMVVSYSIYKGVVSPIQEKVVKAVTKE